MSMYEKMYLITEQEYNLREPLGVTLPTYKSPDEKALERDFKFLGNWEDKAKLLYDAILKLSRVNDKNEWYEKREDTLPVSGTNVVDLITYAVKGTGDQPHGWYLFVEFLKKQKSIPRSLLAKKVIDSLDNTITTVPLGGGPTVVPSTPAPPQPAPAPPPPLAPIPLKPSRKSLGQIQQTTNDDENIPPWHKQTSKKKNVAPQDP